MTHLIGSVNKKMLRQVIEALEEGETLFRITSHGGDPYIALAIAGLLHKAKVTIEVYGHCASAATLLLAAGKHRKVHKWAWIMVHETSEAVEGNATYIKNYAKHMERDELHWNKIMEELTGTDAKLWEKLNEKDTYLTADECLKLNLATEVF